MKLSIFIQLLQDEQEKHPGDPDVIFITPEYHTESGPGFSVGGSGPYEKWRGTVKGIRISIPYPNQLEIRTTK